MPECTPSDLSTQLRQRKLSPVQPECGGTATFNQRGASSFWTRGWIDHQYWLGCRQASPAYGAIYSGTKGAVNSITLSLSKELGPRKIRVNALNPGLIEREGSAADGGLENDFAKLVQKTTPLGGIGVPQDIANVPLFLASDESSWVSGQDIIVAGGFTM